MPRPARRALAILAAAGLLLTGACAGSDDDAAPSGTAEPAATTEPADWPWVGFDDSGSRANPTERTITAETVASLEPIWSLDGLGGMSSTPTIVDGTVYLGDWNGVVHALDADTGEPVWETDIGSTVMGSVTVAGDDVFVAGTSSLVRLDRATGEERWRASTSDHPIAISPASPVVVGDVVIQAVASGELMIPRDTYTFRGSVRGFDRDSGEPRWELVLTPDDDTGGAGVGIWSTAAVDPGRGVVYVGTGNTYEPPAAELSDSLVAIEAATGAIVWSTQFTYPDVWSTGHSGGLDADVGANPNLWSADGRDLVGAGDKAGMYHALDRETGAVVWETQLTPGSSLGGVIGAAAHLDGTIFVASNVGNPENNAPTGAAELLALDDATGEIRWRIPVEGTVYAPVSATPGLVYVASTAALLVVLDADDGTELARFEAPDQSGSGPSVVDGTLYWGYGFTLFGRGSGLGGAIAMRPAGDTGGGGFDGGLATDAPDDESPGARIYRVSCASCHGRDGTGITGPSLVGVADRLTADEHLATVRNGRAQMPGFGGILTDEELEAVVAYERESLDG